MSPKYLLFFLFLTLLLAQDSTSDTTASDTNLPINSDSTGSSGNSSDSSGNASTPSENTSNASESSSTSSENTNTTQNLPSTSNDSGNASNTSENASGNSNPSNGNSNSSENTQPGNTENTSAATENTSAASENTSTPQENTSSENTSTQAENTSNTSENTSESTSTSSEKSSTPSENTSNTSENTNTEKTSNNEDTTPSGNTPNTNTEENTSNTNGNTSTPSENNQSKVIALYENLPERLQLNRGQSTTFVFMLLHTLTVRKIALLITPFQSRRDPGRVSLYMTFNQTPPSIPNHEFLCEKVLLGFSKPCLVTVPGGENENETHVLNLTILAVCETESCDLKLRVLHENEVYLKKETKEVYSFDREEAEIFSFTVPEKKTFARIVFMLTFKNMGENLYEMKPNKPEEVLYFTSGEPQFIKNNHQIFAIFNQTDAKLCESCNVTFYMTSRVGIVMELEVFYFNTTSTPLQLNHEYFDYITANGPLLYEIDIPDDEILKEGSPEKLFFTLNSFSGSEKILYVNPDNNPYMLESFAWNSTLKQYFEEEDIILTYAQLKASGHTGKRFFLAVKSNHPGLYKLEVKASVAPFVKLAFGITESSVVPYMGLDYYELELWATEQQEAIVEVKLVNEKGNSDMYGRICQYDEMCDLITNQQIVDKKNIEFYSQAEGNDQIKLNPRCPFAHAYCYVLIAVRGYSLTTSLNKYSITVSKKNGLVNLLENKNHESHVDFSSATRFKLIVHDLNDDVEDIHFKVTADLPISVSKDNECGDLDKSCDVRYGDTRHPVVYSAKDGKMDGVYYVSVTGVKSTNFFIFPQVKRKSKAKTPIKLSEGKIYRDALSMNSTFEYFTFHITVETLTNIDINIQGARNRFQVYASDDEKLPDSAHYNWETTTNFLRIPQEVTRESGAYDKIFFVRVQALNQIDLLGLNKTLDFEITYSTDHTIKTLEKNRIFHDSVKEKFYRFYLLFVDHVDEKIAFLTHILNPSHLVHSLKMYVSADPFPHYFTYNKTMFTDAETEKLVLSQADILKLCGPNNHHCPIYLSIQNTDEHNEITYSLMVEVSDLAVELKEGFEQKMVITEPSFRAYFLPSNKDQAVDIFAYSHKENFELYVSVFKDDKHLVNTQGFEGQYPQKNHSQFTSPMSNRHSLTIKTSNLQNCWPDCVILMGMQFPKSINYDAGFPIYMLISDDLIEFMEGKPLVFTLEKFHIKYFSYDLMDLYKSFNDKESIVITLTPFYGLAHIYLSVSMNNVDMRPSLTSHQFQSFADHIELNRSQILKGLHVADSKSLKTLKLIISVYGVMDGKFILSILSEKQVTPHLFSGMPQEVLLAAGYKLVSQYFNGDNEVLKLSFNREGGLGSILVTPCNPQIESENTFDKCLKKISSHYSIITGSGSSLIRLSETTVEDYCKSCVFLVTLKAVSDLKGSLLISHPDSIIGLQEGRKIMDELDPNEKNRYTMYMQDFREFEIVVSVFTGHVEVCFSYKYIGENGICDFKQSKTEQNGLITMRIPARTYTQPEDRESEINGDVRLHFNNFFVKVSSHVKSTYAITYIQSNAQILQSGVISYDRLPAGGKKEYIHRYYDLDASPHITLSCLEQCNENDLVLVARYRPLGSFSDNDVRVINLDVEPLFKTNKTSSYKLPKEKASFEFTVINHAKNPLNYSIVINGRDVAIMPYDFNYQGVLEARHSKYYEIYVPKKGHLVLEMMECFGEVQILVSRSYEKVIKEEFDEEFKPLKDQPFIHVLKVTKGMIYIAVNNFQTMVAAFEFSLHFYETYLEIPQTRLNGELVNYFMDQNKFQIVLKPISCSDCTEKELSSTNVTYFAILAENRTVLNVAGKCGIGLMPGSGLDIKTTEFFHEKMLTHKLIDSNKSESLILSLDVKVKNRNYFVTVKAVIDYLGEKKLVNFYYPTMEVFVSQKFIESKWFVLIMGLASMGVFLGCCLFGIYYYGKYKRVEKKLLYEMEDPKNVTQVSGVNLYEPQNVSSIEMENRTYQGLN